MEKYSSYKDSGVHWLGEIPSHWSLRKMKYTFVERSQKAFLKSLFWQLLKAMAL